jgi:uncharacterized membrane protein YeiB
MNPIEIKHRIEILDYLRGFALLGIILVNILSLLDVKTPAANTADTSYQLFLYLFVEGRFYTIFSFLFGVGFYLFLKRAYEKGENGVLLFLRRMLTLFIFGMIHVQFHPGEALSVYGLCGIIILPFYKVSKKVNLLIGILLLAVFAAFSVKIFMTLPLMLLGICAGQYRIFAEISNKTKQVAVFTIMMFIGSIVGLGYQAAYIPSVIDTSKPQKFLEIGIEIGPFISAFYVGILLLSLRLPLVKRLLLPVKNYGRMALTNYIMQTVLILIFGNIFTLFSNITYIQSLYICFTVYAIQLIFSTIWLQYFRFGPLEWIWRIATYRTIPPMRSK